MDNANISLRAAALALQPTRPKAAATLYGLATLQETGGADEFEREVADKLRTPVADSEWAELHERVWLEIERRAARK